LAQTVPLDVRIEPGGHVAKQVDWYRAEPDGHDVHVVVELTHVAHVDEQLTQTVPPGGEVGRTEPAGHALWQVLWERTLPPVHALFVQALQGRVHAEQTLVEASA